VPSPKRANQNLDSREVSLKEGRQPALVLLIIINSSPN
jgi:hypothetical protein